MSLRIFSWNVNGIRSVAKKGFADFLRDYSPDILCLQETRAEPLDFPDNLANPEGYFAYHESAAKKGYSGVSLYSKVEPLVVHHRFENPRFNEEGRIQIADFGFLVLFNLYFPNGGQSEDRLDYKMGFCEQLLNEVQNYSDRRILVCGDYNTAHRPIDLKNPKANEKISGFLPQERAWIDRFIDAGFNDVFRHVFPETIRYSWWSYRFNCRAKDIGWRIDYHFANDSLLSHIQAPVIHTEVEGSDHCPVSILVDWEA